MRAAVLLLLVALWCIAIAPTAVDGAKAKKGAQKKAPRKQKHKEHHVYRDEEDSDGGAGHNTKIIGADLKVCLQKAMSVLDKVECFEIAVAEHGDNKDFVQFHIGLAWLYHEGHLAHKARAQLNTTYHKFLTRYEVMLGQLREDIDGREPTCLEVMKFFRRWEVPRFKELGWAVTKLLEYEGKVSEAHALHTELMVPAGHDAALEEFSRSMGNILGEVTLRKDAPMKTSVLYRLGESIPFILEAVTKRVLSLARVPTPSDPLTMYCGVNITWQVTEMKGTEIIAQLMACLEKHTDLAIQLKAEAGPDWEEVLGLRPYAYLRFTALHRLAAHGALHPIQKAYQHYGNDAVNSVRDIFNRSPLHSATATGALPVVKYLMSQGLDLYAPDYEGYTATFNGCLSPKWKDEFETEVLMSLQEPRTCSGLGKTRFEQDTDEVDETGDDGGWNAGIGRQIKDLRPQCVGVDQLDAKVVHKHSHMMALYVYANRPAVLRGSFFPDGPDPGWEKADFVATFGHVIAREESTPESERFHPDWRAETTTVAHFLRRRPKKRFAVVDVLPKTALFTLSEWIPKPLRIEQTEEDLHPFISAALTMPRIVLFTPGAQSIHVQKGTTFVFILVFGMIDFQLLPPKDALTTNRPLSELAKAKAIDCTMITGDTLVVPEMWSMSYRARTDGVLVVRPMEYNGHDRAPIVDTKKRKAKQLEMEAKMKGKIDSASEEKKIPYVKDPRGEHTVRKPTKPQKPTTDDLGELYEAEEPSKVQTWRDRRRIREANRRKEAEKAFRMKPTPRYSDNGDEL